VATTETDYPANWIFDEDGDEVAGTFVAFDEGQTRDYGLKPILILDGVGDPPERRTVWLFGILPGQFAKELERRGTGDLVVGERIVITRLGEKQSESTGRMYTDYRVLFPDRPAKSASDILGVRDKPAEKPDEDDGSVPF
jgi:hypothetical protein